jgi:hypothetical protein
MGRIQNRVRTSEISASQILAASAGLALAAALSHAQPIPVLFNGSVSTSYHVPGNWDGGVIPQNTGGLFYAPIIGAGLTANFTTGNQQIDAAQLNTNARLRLAPNTTLRIRGSGAGVGVGQFTLLEGSAFEINQSGTGFADFILDGSGAVIFGSGVGTPGSVLMSASLNNRIYSSSAVTTLQNEATFAGGGTIGLNQTPIDNRGIFRAAPGTTMILNASGTLQNRGLLEADAGTLTLRNAIGNITVGPQTGTVRAVNGGVVRVEGSISGGIFQTADAGSVIRSGGGSINNATLDGALVEVPISTGLSIQGTIAGTPSSEIRLLQSGTGNSELILTGNSIVTISGPNITMTNNAGNRIYSNSGAATLQLASGSNITGGGNIGLGQTVINVGAGSTIATGTTSLVIQGNGIGTDNNGTLEARSGGTLFLTSVIDNSGGVVQAQTGSVVDLEGCNLSGGTLRSFGTGFIIANSPTPRIQNFSLTQGEIRVFQSSAMRVAGTNTIDGALTLNQSGTGNSDVLTIGDVTFNGTGEIRANTNANNRIYSESGAGLLTLNVPFRGAGQIGFAQTPMVFNSIVENDGLGTLIIQPNGQGLDHNGTIRQSGSGLIQLRGRVFGEQGRVEVTGTGNIDLDGCHISGGVLADTGDGLFIVNANTPLLQDLAIESGEVRIALQSSARTIGTIVLDGIISLNQSGTGVCDLIAAGNGTTTYNGSGQIRLNTSSGNRFYSETSLGVIVLNLPLRGAGQLGVGVTTLVLNSVVENDGAGTLVVQASSSGTDNNGVIRQSGAGFLQLRGFVNNEQGRLEVTGDGFFDLDGCTLVGGTLADTGAGSFYVDAGIPILQSITLESGDVVIGPTAQARFSGINTIAGSLRAVQSGTGVSDIIVTGSVNTTFNGPGQISLTNNAGNRIYSESGLGSITFGPSLTVRGSGQIGVGLTAVTNRGLILSDLSAGMTIGVNSGGFINEGEIRVTGLGSINAFGSTLTQAAGLIQIDAGRLFNRSTGSIVQTGGTILANGELQVVSDNFQLQGGTLAGDGLVDSIVTQTGGTIDPSPSLTIEGGLTQNAASTLRIDLNGTGSNDADLVSVTGPAALNGALRVVIGPNYVITPGDQFVIVNSTGARTGTFSSLVVEPAQLGIDASVQYLSNSVVLTIDGCVICGYCNYDYNRDENVDLLDAQQMAQVFVGLIQPEANWLDGDLNLDENADLTDAQLLARAIVQGLCEL